MADDDDIAILCINTILCEYRVTGMTVGKLERGIYLFIIYRKEEGEEESPLLGWMEGWMDG